MASKMPKVYFGLHFVAGPAEYSGPEDRIYVGEEAAKQMDSTFPGCPVYVGHKPVDLENIQEADGYVVESFFNKNDGKHWAKFVIVSDAGHEAIENGWKLSNAYVPTKKGEGGLCHNIEYNYEVLEGNYNHLAIVKVPRYEESVIMTTEAFKEYNEKKENELKLLQNEKEEIVTEKKEVFMNFKFFAKKEIENSADIESATVILKNGAEVTVAKLVEMANAKNEAESDEEKKKKENEAEEKEKEEEEKKNAAEKEEKEKKEMDEKKNEILNAMNVTDVAPRKLDTQANQVARGASRYGSTKK